MIHKIDPSTGLELEQFHISTPEEVGRAVQRARAAFPKWSALSLKERLKRLDALRAVIRKNGDKYARTISQDTGKPYGDSLLTELMSIPMFIDYYKKNAEQILARKKTPPSIIFPGKTGYIEYFPMGVIGVISPWNFPFQLSMIPILSALIAGNTVVLKPSEITPLTGEIIRECFQKIGLPQGVVEVVQGDGSTGAALVEDDIDKIFFTGSLKTGKRVMAAAAKKPIPVELELGGKDAMIVCHDANLPRAAKAAVWGGFVNCGQMCISVERLFVVDSVYKEFTQLVKNEVDALRVGAPNEDADIGPLTSEMQRNIVEKQVQKALKEGARILSGGTSIARPGYFYAPTLITDVTENMSIYQEETFGPVLPIIRVQTEEEAIELANNHQYGLTGSIWTKDIQRGIKLASRMQSGQCSVNEIVTSVGNPALPFGGVKGSGFGRYHGAEGLLAFSHQKSIFVDRGWLKSEPFWFPYAGKYDELKSLFDGLVSDNLPKAATSLTKLIIRMNSKG